MRNPVLLAVLFAALSTPSFAQKATPQQAAPQAVPVTTVIAQEKPVAQAKDFVGRIEAIERVEVRARVTGYLDAVLFKEGELVQGGTAPLPHRAGHVQGSGRTGGSRACGRQGIEEYCPRLNSTAPKSFCRKASGRLKSATRRKPRMKTPQQTS